eukprot:gene9634-biopygen9211
MNRALEQFGRETWHAWSRVSSSVSVSVCIARRGRFTRSATWVEVAGKASLAALARAAVAALVRAVAAASSADHSS